MARGGLPAWRKAVVVVAMVVGFSTWIGTVTGGSADSASELPSAEVAFVATLAGQLKGLLLPGGQTLWQTPLPSSFKTPLSISIPRVGSQGYVLARSGYNRTAALVPFSLRSGRLGRPIEVGLPGAVAIAPNGGRAWVANSGNLSGLPGPTGTTVTPVDLRTGRRLRPIRVGGQPGGLALTPSGARLLVTLPDRGSVVPVSTTSGRLGAPIRLPVSSAIPPRQTVPGAIVVDGPEDVALVGNLQEDLGFPTDVVNVLDLKTLRPESPIDLGPLGNSAQALVVSTDGRSVFAASYLGVIRIDVAARDVDLAIANSYRVWGMAIDANTLYLSQEIFATANLSPVPPGATGYALVPVDLSSMAPGQLIATTATPAVAIELRRVSLTRLGPLRSEGNHTAGSRLVGR